MDTKNFVRTTYLIFKLKNLCAKFFKLLHPILQCVGVFTNIHVILHVQDYEYRKTWRDTPPHTATLTTKPLHIDVTYFTY